MDITLLIGIIVVILALAFALSNGFNDSANIVATIISTRAMEPTAAILYASAFEFLGAYFLGATVAKTLAKGIIDPFVITGDPLGIIVVIATLIGATFWNILCTILGFPISASHSLIGGFVGSGIAAAGLGIVQWNNIAMIFIFLILAPFLGLIGSYIITKLTYFFASSASNKINKLFRFLQIIASMGFAFSYGTNDAPKTMGIIVFSLVVLGLYTPPEGAMVIPKWVTISCALSITIGILAGGKSVIKTVGMKIFKIKQVNGFCAQTAGAIVVYLASSMGMPVSSTHIISSSVMGTGMAERPKSVKWGVGYSIFWVWIITMPAAALVSGVMHQLIYYSTKLIINIF